VTFAARVPSADSATDGAPFRGVALVISVPGGVASIAPIFAKLKRSTRDLRKRQRQLQSILDHTPAAVAGFLQKPYTAAQGVRGGRASPGLKRPGTTEAPSRSKAGAAGENW